MKKELTHEERAIVIHELVEVLSSHLLDRRPYLETIQQAEQVLMEFRRARASGNVKRIGRSIVELQRFYRAQIEPNFEVIMWPRHHAAQLQVIPGKMTADIKEAIYKRSKF